jgi:two-component system chemotaxis sensor kinase CheA
VTPGSWLGAVDLRQLQQFFLGETEEDLGLVEEALLALRQTPTDRDKLATILRKFHSLKGSAACVGFHRLAGLAHLLESRLQVVRERAEPIVQEEVAFLLRAVDALREALPLVAAGRDELSPAGEALRAEMDGETQRAPAESSPKEIPPEVREVERRADAHGTLRISVERLDGLLDLTTEIAIARAHLETVIARQGSPEVGEAYVAMERLLAQMHCFVTDLRMVPLAPLFRQYARVVHDIATEQQKDVSLEVVDQGVEVDASVLEQLRAPLTHMVRNSVSHGIETPTVRRRLAKPRGGRIVLRAQHEEGAIAIAVEDDGGGLDRTRILAKARESGLVAADDTLSEREIDRLIFQHGFSTSRELTSMSGRGVGMDVVLRHLEGLGGSIEVESHAGKGTRFTLRVPLTLAIIEAFVVSVAGETYVIPVGGIMHCLDVPRSAKPDAPDGVIEWDGQAVPFVRLRSALGLEGAAPPAEVAFIVQRDGGPVGIAVDRLVGRRQIVVKPGGPFFKGLPAFSGLTILGDGRVAPILSVAGVLHGHVGRHASASEPAPNG